MKAVIFDFDGLMVDTEPISYLVYQKFLGNYGISLSLEEYTHLFSGKPTASSLSVIQENYHIPCNTQKILCEIMHLESMLLNEHNIRLKKGLRNLLLFLNDNHIKMIIATSSTKDRAMKILDQHHIVSYFDDFVFTQEVSHGKPFPDIFLLACQKLEVDPAEALVLEDSETGIEAAYRAGIPVICIPDLKEPSDPYKSYTTRILPSLDDLIVWLQQPGS